MKKWVSIVFSVYLLMASSPFIVVAKQNVSAREGAKAATQASGISWKGFSKGKLAEHYEKHVLIQGEFGNITKAEYLNRAKSFATEVGKNFKEKVVGNLVVKHDSVTGRTLIGRLKDREIRTFYIDTKSASPFEEAVKLAEKLVK